MAEVARQINRYAARLASALGLQFCHQLAQQEGMLLLVHDHAGLDDVLHGRCADFNRTLSPQFVQFTYQAAIFVEHCNALAQSVFGDGYPEHAFKILYQRTQCLGRAVF
ncbi:hypothetical protein D3C84_1047840 [compost metagenome]